MNIASLVPPKNLKIPPLAPGDTVKVHTRIVEAGKERIQVLQGIVIRIKRGGNGASFTVRHVAYGVGVERTFPFQSPRVETVEILRHGKVRRAKLYYLRGRSGKSARLKERRVENEQLGLEAEEIVEEVEVAPEELVEAVKEEATATAPAIAEVVPEEAATQPVAEVKSESPEQPVAEAEPAKAEIPPETEKAPEEEKKE